MGTFFVSWELWIQMTFVLGAALFLTIIYGLARLLVVRRRENAFLKEKAKATDPENGQNAAAGGPVGSSFDSNNATLFGVDQLLYGTAAKEVVDMSRAGSRAGSAFSTPRSSFTNLHGVNGLLGRPESNRSIYTPPGAIPHNRFNPNSSQLSIAGIHSGSVTRVPSRAEMASPAPPLDPLNPVIASRYSESGGPNLLQAAEHGQLRRQPPPQWPLDANGPKPPTAV